MKIQLLSLTFLVASCGGGGGGGSSGCEPGLTGTFSSLDGTKTITMGSCGMSYVNDVNGCGVYGSYPYIASSSGSIDVTINLYSESACGHLSSPIRCGFIIPSNNSIQLNCPAAGISYITFYRD